MILYLGTATQMRVRAYQQARSRLTSSPGYTRSEPRPSLHRFEPRSFAPHQRRASDLTQFTVSCRPSPKQESTSLCQRITLRPEGRLSPSTGACSNARDLVPRRGGLPSSTARHNKALGTRAKDTTRTGQSPEIKKGLRHRAVHYFDACTSHQTTLKQKLRYHLQTLDPAARASEGLAQQLQRACDPKRLNFFCHRSGDSRLLAITFGLVDLGGFGTLPHTTPGAKGHHGRPIAYRPNFFDKALDTSLTSQKKL